MTKEKVECWYCVHRVHAKPGACQCMIVLKEPTFNRYNGQMMDEGERVVDKTFSKNVNGECPDFKDVQPQLSVRIQHVFAEEIKPIRWWQFWR